jgi:hypothetical protein
LNKEDYTTIVLRKEYKPKVENHVKRILERGKMHKRQNRTQKTIWRKNTIENKDIGENIGECKSCLYVRLTTQI